MCVETRRNVEIRRSGYANITFPCIYDVQVRVRVRDEQRQTLTQVSLITFRLYFEIGRLISIEICSSLPFFIAT